MSELVSVDDGIPQANFNSGMSKCFLGYCSYDNCQYTVIMLDGKFHHFDCGRIVHGGITHWMPLPAPPES